MVSSSKKKEHATAVVEFKTILRVRPLLKKERDDPVALEALSCGTAVALHPPIVKDLAITGVCDTTTTVVAGEDVEFTFDRVLTTSASQAKVYAVAGQPMALQAMESLKSNYTNASSRGRDRHQSDKPTTASSRRAHLIIGMGLAYSGTTHTCLAGNTGTTGISGTGTTGSSSGGCTVSSKRKLDTDGLVPRILDSLFSQSKHHPHPEATSSSKKVTFAVKMTMIQVNQSKTNPSDCHIFDLVRPSKPTGNCSNGGTTTGVSASAVVGQLGSNINSFAASFLSSMDLNAKKTPSAQTTTGMARRRGNPNTSYAALDETVQITQDPVTSDCVVHNAIERTCTSPEEARATLQHALAHAKQLSMVHKKVQSHLWIQLTPVWILTSHSSSRGTTTRCQFGDTMAILDMASWEQPSKRTRTREEQSNRGSDAHTAVMHCLKAIQYNQQSMTTSPTSSDKLRALRKVPFLQHPVTMLVQPLLVRTSIVHLTLLVTASPSNRDYMEKKVLLTEIMPFHHSNNVVAKLVPTTMDQVDLHQLSSPRLGSEKLSSHKESTSSQRHCRHPSSNPKRQSYGHASDAEDEASLERKRRSKPLKPRPEKHLVSAYDASFMMLNNELDAATKVKEEEVDDEPEDSFVGYDSGLLARDASKSTLCVVDQPKSLERKHSMSYSESTEEQDDDDDNPDENGPHSEESARRVKVCPRPPPVAPGYMERILQHTKSSHLGSPPASAPIEDDTSCSQPPPPILTVDFPGVVMPLPSTRSALTEATTIAATPKVSKQRDDMPSPCIPIDTAEETFGDQPKFSYMKTINKVVHASKKKGRKVIERMTVTTVGSSDHSQVQQQIAELEMQNAALVRENADLLEQNERLLEQLYPMSKKKRTSAPTTPITKTQDSPSVKQTVGTPDSNMTSSFILDPSSNVLQNEKTIGIGNDESEMMNSPGSSSTFTGAVVHQPLKERRNSMESCVPDQLYDNPMFRHMASMNSQPSDRWKPGPKSNSVTHRTYEKTYNVEDTNDFSDDSSDENTMLDSFKADAHEKTLFDDPLLQHMAMMNY